MKRILFVACAVLLFTGAVPFKVRHALDRAVENEREAAARYEAFAAKATEEGYPGAANLFRAAARAEMVHADRFATALKARNLPVPAPGEYQPHVGTTAENLSAAANSEIQERDGFYRDAIDDARDGGDAELAQIFDQTRDTEIEHSNLLLAASRNAEKLRTAKTFYVCDRCGYTTDVNLSMCVLCRLDKHPHPVE